MRLTTITMTILVLLMSVEQVAAQEPTQTPRAYLPFVYTAPFDPYAGMITIEAGSFWMGCDPSKPNEECASDELPIHEASLDTYLIDSNETTIAEYKACVEAGVCSIPIYTYSYSRPDYYSNPLYANYPVVFVTWFQADTYCHWRGKRLPTEAEWEKAARGAGDRRMYPWGNSAVDCSKANYNAQGATGYCVGDTSAVGSYPSGASPYGLLDMAGNVREWVSDWYDPDFYKYSPVENPSGPADGVYKVMRGGRWASNWTAVRVAARKSIGPFDYGDGIGFRCAAP